MGKHGDELEALYGDLYRQYRAWREGLPWHCRVWWETRSVAQGMWRALDRRVLRPLRWWLWRRPTRAVGAWWHRWQHRHDPPLRCAVCGADDEGPELIYALGFTTLGQPQEFLCETCMRGGNNSGVSVTTPWSWELTTNSEGDGVE